MTRPTSSARKTLASASKAEVSAGGVVFKFVHSRPVFCMLLDHYGCWTCPKGHVEPGESPIQAALREVREEVGLAGLEVIGRIGLRRYSFRRGRRRIAKAVHWFLMRARPSARLRPSRRQHILDARWMHLDTAIERCGYPGVRSLLRRAAARAGAARRDVEMA